MSQQAHENFGTRRGQNKTCARISVVAPQHVAQSGSKPLCGINVHSNTFYVAKYSCPSFISCRRKLVVNEAPDSGERARSKASCYIKIMREESGKTKCIQSRHGLSSAGEHTYELQQTFHCLHCGLLRHGWGDAPSCPTACDLPVDPGFCPCTLPPMLST